MSELKTIVLECGGCTAPLSEAIVAKGVHKCPYCGYVNILPKQEQSSEVIHYLRAGDIELKNGDFERAYNAYSEAVRLDPSESKGYFGMALSTNRVKYVRDVVNNRWQAICCQISEKKFLDDTNFKRAVQCATQEQMKEYTSRANEIDYIREKFVELAKSGLEYDTFICVKVSDGRGGFTSDSHWAGKLYDNLKKIGIKPFYSEREIGDRTGEDYEALILYALHTSKSMVVVCSDEDYLRTPWVQNEYSRYYSMMSQNDKLKNSIMIAFSDTVIENLPGIAGKIQGVDLHSFDASQKINEFVSKFANAEERARKKAEREAKAEAERRAEKEAEKKARQEQQKMLEELQKQLQETRNSVQTKQPNAQDDEKKYCSKCGAKNKIDVRFCYLCGNSEFLANDEKFCTSCKQVNSISTKHCVSCGKSNFVNSLEECERIIVERLAREKVEAERKAREEAELNAKKEAERIAREKREAEARAQAEKVERLRLRQERKKKRIKRIKATFVILLILACAIAGFILFHPHEYSEWEIVNDPTCTDIGLKKHTCKYWHFEEEEIPATGHTYGEWETVTEPTCTDAGLKKQTCTKCANSVEEEIPATGHTNGEWETVTEPTCTEAGLKKQTCTKCANSVEKELSATGHAYGKWETVTEPTCTEAGIKKQTCGKCSHSAEKTIPAGHIYGEWKIITEATCTEVGLKRQICSKCTNFVEREIPVTDHTYGEWEIVTYPTSDKSGVKRQDCACGYFVEEELNSIKISVEKYLCGHDTGYDMSTTGKDESGATGDFEVGHLEILGCVQDKEFLNIEHIKVFEIQYVFDEDPLDLPYKNAMKVYSDTEKNVKNTGILNEKIGMGAYEIKFKDKSGNTLSETVVVRNFMEGNLKDSRVTLLTADDLPSGLDVSGVSEISITIVYEIEAYLGWNLFNIGSYDYTDWRCEYTFKFN